MAVGWHLKKYLASQHGIFTAIALQALVVKRTGIIVSHSNLCRYLKKQPRALKLELLELLCNTLDCELSELLTIHPNKYRKVRSLPKKHAQQHTPKQKRGKRSFPDPVDYEP